MLIFKEIVKDDIFTNQFKSLKNNNRLIFPSSGEEIIVLYGPNGTGKTSLAKVLSDFPGTKLEFMFDEIEYKTGSTIFHVINDQNNRNIILGETEDFFLGDNIKREFELQKQINNDRILIVDEIISKLKANHNLSSANSPLLKLIEDVEINEVIKDIVNNKTKGKSFSTDSLIKKLSKITFVHHEIDEEEQVKLVFLKSDYVKKDSILQKIEQLGTIVKVSPNIHEVEENTEAIRILNRFLKDQCIVCDTENIDRELLLHKKKNNRAEIIEQLDEKSRVLVNMIIELAPENDPFNIKKNLLDDLSSGESDKIINLVTEIKLAKVTFNILLLNEVASIIAKSELKDKIGEYNKLINSKPEISEEDMLYIEEIINNSMQKKLSLKRDENKNLRIFLSDEEFLGKPRSELPLSTGEQNFLSLTFEFLKARNSNRPIVVIDDPISSFDSIYKNKVVYAIIKILHNKKRIILSHNTDLLRLLDGQHKQCFKVYLLNNTEDEENGFIPLSSKEQETLISLERLIKTFRNEVFDQIIDVEMFLIAMIPFMRGYANIIGNDDVVLNLNHVMHGYKNEKIDIAAAYIQLFGRNSKGKIPDSYLVSVSDILTKSLDNVVILDCTQYSLLNKTLRHSFIYLFLRLLVEKKLVNKYNIDTSRNKQLGQIINAAYPDDKNIKQIRNRIRLTTKKTLINEFNHFEGNLSIFQPAIDITDHSLNKEYLDLMQFIETL